MSTNGTGPSRQEVARYAFGLVSLALLSAIIALAAWALLPATAPGWSPTVVSSDSMAPLIRRGDVIVISTPGDGPLGPPNVVLFDNGSGNGPVLHRIVDTNGDGTLVTRGDANSIADSTPLAPEQVAGVGRLVVPLVGFPSAWLSEGAAGLVATAAALVLLVAWGARFALYDRYDPWLAPRPAPEPVVAPETPAPRATARHLRGRRGSMRRALRSSADEHDDVAPGTAFSRTSRRTALLLACLGLTLLAGAPTASAYFSGATTAAGSWSTGEWHTGPGPFYLKTDVEGDTQSQLMLPMSEDEPTQTSLPNYSTDLGDGPGRLIKRGGGLNVEETQIWSTGAVTDGLVIHGDVNLILWAAIAGEQSATAAGAMDAVLADCAADLSDCDLLGGAQVSDDPWGTTPGFIRKQLGFGDVEHTIAEGRALLVAVFVDEASADDMWLAYDTVDHPSRLEIDPAPAPATPQNLAVTGTDGSSVDLAWDASDGADEYRVRYRNGSADWTETDAIDGTTTTVGDLDPGVTYEFQVRAEHFSRSSAWSASVTGTTAASSTVQLTGGGTAGAIGPGMDFHVYVGAGGVVGTADVSSVADGRTDVALTDDGGPWSVDGVTYTHRSADPVTADDGLEDGDYPYTILVDGEPQGFTLTVDNDATVAPASNLTAQPGCLAPDIGLRSTSTVSTGNISLVTIARPAGVEQGDVMLASLYTVNAVTVNNKPDGWELLEHNGHQRVYYRVAGDQEPASYTWTLNSNSRTAGAIVAYHGVDPDDPIDGHAGATGTGDTLTAPSVEATAGGRLVALFGRRNQGAISPPDGMVQRWNVEAGTGGNADNWVRSVGLDQTLAADGPTGSRTATAGSERPWAAALVALRPIGGAQVGLDWDPTPSDFADGYVLERWRDGELEESWEITSRETTTFDDAPLSPDTTYTYRLRATAGDWRSEALEVTTTTPACG